MLVEYPYIDRYYLHDFQNYYSTALVIPNHRTSRVHFFAAELGQSIHGECFEPDQIIDRQKYLQSVYIGFVVIRPIPAAPIGRTVIRPWYDSGRCFGPTPSPPHRVHLAGFNLKAYGTPFHQQDSVVGACATAAVWMAVSHLSGTEGTRPITPAMITLAAGKSSPERRLFPAADGFTRQQMAAALIDAGFPPEAVKSKDKYLFIALLKIYLRSGFPVILILHIGSMSGEHHAVTLIGFREAEDNIAITMKNRNGQPINYHTRGVGNFYIHDDRIGPYRSAIIDSNHDALGTLCLLDDRDDDSIDYSDFALIPLNPKIRLTATDLVNASTELEPLLRASLPLLTTEIEEEGKVLFTSEPYFTTCGEYMANLLKSTIVGLPASRKVRIASSLSLSRNIGIVRLFVNGTWFLDAIYDSTESIRQESGRFSGLVCCIPHDNILEYFEKFFSARRNDPTTMCVHVL